MTTWLKHAAAGGLALAFVAGAALAKDRDGDTEHKRLADPEISIERAMEIAKTRASGRIDEIYLDEFDEGPAYVVALSSDTSNAEVLIDGDNGEVLTIMNVTSANARVHTAVLKEIDEDDMMLAEFYEEAMALPFFASSTEEERTRD